MGAVSKNWGLGSICVNARFSTSRFLEPQTRVRKIYKRMSGLDDVAYQTLELLESRLRRVAFILDGDLRQDESKQKHSLSVPERIQKLEDSLLNLSSKTALISEAQRLSM